MFKLWSFVVDGARVHFGPIRKCCRNAMKTSKYSVEDIMEELRNVQSIGTVIELFRSLELSTAVSPMRYDHNAESVVSRVYEYMSVTNRSVSSIDLLKTAAAILVNLARYNVTGPMIYSRDRIGPILKLMWRFSNRETQLICIFSTYLWLWNKYDEIKEDLKEFLHLPENHKMMLTIKGNVDRQKRMANNARNKFHTPQQIKFLWPSLEPDYGMVRRNMPRYFEDAQQAINCVFQTYNL